jgi:hypothetical protein
MKHDVLMFAGHTVWILLLVGGSLLVTKVVQCFIKWQWMDSVLSGTKYYLMALAAAEGIFFICLVRYHGSFLAAVYALLVWNVLGPIMFLFHLLSGLELAN